MALLLRNQNQQKRGREIGGPELKKQAGKTEKPNMGSPKGGGKKTKKRELWEGWKENEGL